VTRICLVCGNPLPIKKAKYCCYDCSYSAQLARIKERVKQKPKVKLKVKVCIVCGKEFTPVRGQQIYCSKVCGRNFTNKIARECRASGIKTKSTKINPLDEFELEATPIHKLPKISIHDVIRFQMQYDQDNKKLISYTDAVKMMEGNK